MPLVGGCRANRSHLLGLVAVSLQANATLETGLLDDFRLKLLEGGGLGDDLPSLVHLHPESLQLLGTQGHGLTLANFLRGPTRLLDLNKQTKTTVDIFSSIQLLEDGGVCERLVLTAASQVGFSRIVSSKFSASVPMCSEVDTCSKRWT